MNVDRKSAEQAIAAFLRALGHDPERCPELAQTPSNVVRAYVEELLRGHDVDLAQLLIDGSAVTADEPPPGLVAVRDVDVATLCPHHLMPALGKATVAYLPGDRLLGVGTLARLVDACARRLTMQEAIGQRVVDALMDHAGAKGAYCRLSLRHGCLTARGACQPDSTVESTATAGKLQGPTGAAALALALDEEPR
jgi:GTP cyclohydrolase I